MGDSAADEGAPRDAPECGEYDRGGAKASPSWRRLDFIRAFVYNSITMDSIGKSRGKNIFGFRLHRARKAAGLSLRALGERVGLSAAALKKYEDNDVIPPGGMLGDLSDALDVRWEYFLRPYDAVRLEGIEYRKRGPLPKKLVDAIIYEVADQVERRVELENLYPNPPVPEFEAIPGMPDAIESMGQIEQLADGVRLSWELGWGPIPDLIGALEANGLRIFTIDAKAGEQFDGLLARAGDIPILVVDSDWPGERQRFTLAHELGHLMLEGRLAGGIDAENACNRFAGALLFPRKSVMRELGGHRIALETRELALLKKKFGLSMAGILHRAHDLGVIPDSHHKEHAKRFREKGWNLREPGEDYPAEDAFKFQQLIFRAFAEEYINMSKAAELLGISLHDFRQALSLGTFDGTASQ